MDEYDEEPPEWDAENRKRMGKIKRDVILKYYQKVFRPGALMVTSGRRGGGKTRSAISFAQMLVNGTYPELGKWRVATNVIFVRNLKSAVCSKS